MEWLADPHAWIGLLTLTALEIVLGIDNARLGAGGPWLRGRDRAGLAFAGPVSDFVHRHPTVTVLALSFLLLIGVLLVAEGCHQHIPKGYVYFAMAFSVFVEALNLRARRRRAEPVHLREAYTPEPSPGGQ